MVDDDVSTRTNINTKKRSIKQHIKNVIKWPTDVMAMTIVHPNKSKPYASIYLDERKTN